MAIQFRQKFWGSPGDLRYIAIKAIIAEDRHHIAKIITHLAWENGPDCGRNEDSIRGAR
jgi:hypothetical protein